MWIFKPYKLLSYQEHQELLSIRNEEKIKNASNSSKTIQLDEHLKWLRGITSEQHYFALFIDESIVGGVHFYSKDKIIQNWGIFFSQNTKPFISSMATYMFVEFMFLKHNQLQSEVLKDNKQALKFNKYFGLEIIDEDDKTFYLQLLKEKWQHHKQSLKTIKKRLDLIEYRFFKEDTK